MKPRRDDIEALAGATDLLLKIAEPSHLARNFLAHVVDVFGAGGGLFHLTAPAPGVLCLDGLDSPHGSALVSAIHRELGAQGRDCVIARVDEPGCASFPHVLAAAIPGKRKRRGVLALFAPREDIFDPERDSRLLSLLARHAAAAVAHAALHVRRRRESERFALQAEELAHVHRALERHSREIEHSLAERSRYFASMSHELRTPVNAIVGYTDLLRQGIYGPLSPAQIEAIDRVGASARQLLALVNDILDLSKIDAGRIEIRIHPIDTIGLIHEALEAVEPDARRKGLEVRIHCEEPLPSLRSDPARVRQSLLNLLSNAVKFTDRGSIPIEARHITPTAPPSFPVHPCCAPGEEGWLALAVSDTGIGIPEEQVEHIFSEFVQLPIAMHRQRGTGLGLAISSRLARLLGGEIAVRSEVGVSSTFVLFLPCPAPVLEAETVGA